jgi:hypothetical protein
MKFTTRCGEKTDMLAAANNLPPDHRDTLLTILNAALDNLDEAKQIVEKSIRGL